MEKYLYDMTIKDGCEEQSEFMKMQMRRNYDQSRTDRTVGRFAR